MSIDLSRVKKKHIETVTLSGTPGVLTEVLLPVGFVGLQVTAVAVSTDAYFVYEGEDGVAVGSAAKAPLFASAYTELDAQPYDADGPPRFLLGSTTASQVVTLTLGRKVQ